MDFNKNIIHFNLNNLFISLRMHCEHELIPNVQQSCFSLINIDRSTENSKRHKWDGEHRGKREKEKNNWFKWREPSLRLRSIQRYTRYGHRDIPTHFRFIIIIYWNPRFDDTDKRNYITWCTAVCWWTKFPSNERMLNIIADVCSGSVDRLGMGMAGTNATLDV